MLNNPVQREAVKATGAGLALIAGGPLAASLALVLGVAVESLGYLGETRTRELFNSEDFTNKVMTEIKQSDDFSSLVFDIWTRHNFESSEFRRAMLKRLLEKATYEESRQFENFTKIINVIEQISPNESLTLKAFYSNQAHTFSKFNENGEMYRLNISDVVELLRAVYNKEELDQNTLVAALNQLGHYGLLGVSYNTINGPYYWPIRSGKIFLDYVRGEANK